MSPEQWSEADVEWLRAQGFNDEQIAEITAPWTEDERAAASRLPPLVARLISMTGTHEYEIRRQAVRWIQLVFEPRYGPIPRHLLAQDLKTRYQHIALLLHGAATSKDWPISRLLLLVSKFQGDAEARRMLRLVLLVATGQADPATEAYVLSMITPEIEAAPPLNRDFVE